MITARVLQINNRFIAESGNTWAILDDELIEFSTIPTNIFKALNKDINPLPLDYQLVGQTILDNWSKSHES